jgi:1,4-dihydroxy-2-naphthoyl-CoA hydrolase
MKAQEKVMPCYLTPDIKGKVRIKHLELSSEELVARINNTRTGSIWDILDITLVSADKDKVVATMPIGPQHRQQVGYLHGGVSVVLAESVASLGTALNTDVERQMSFGLEINANHLRPKRDGRLTAVAIIIHRGRTTCVWDIKISDENDKLVCVSRCTVAIVDRPPDTTSPLRRDVPSFG